MSPPPPLLYVCDLRVFISFLPAPFLVANVLLLEGGEYEMNNLGPALPSSSKVVQLNIVIPFAQAFKLIAVSMFCYQPVQIG